MIKCLFDKEMGEEGRKTGLEEVLEALLLEKSSCFATSTDVWSLLDLYVSTNFFVECDLYHSIVNFKEKLKVQN